MDAVAAPDALETDVSREVAEHFAGRPRIPGSVYKLLENTIGMDCIAEPVCCEKSMSARATICTVGVDRIKEVIVPTGVQVENYRKNPVVLWDHGFGSIAFPVGTCDNEGQAPLALDIFDTHIDATCFFTQKTLEGNQLFDLVNSKVVRATSIHVQPIRRQVEQIEGIGKVLLTLESDLIEWSWGCIGVNPEAVAKTLSAGRLAGSPISDPIKFMLAPYAPVRKAWSPGMAFEPPPVIRPETPAIESTAKTLSAADDAAPAPTSDPAAEKKTMSYTAEQLAAMSDEELKAVAEKSVELDDASQALVKAEVDKRAAKPADSAETPEESPAEEEEADDVPSDVPLGAQVLTSLHQSVKGVIETAEAALKPVENTDVKDAVTAELENLRASLTTLEGLFSSAYPDQPGLSSSGESEMESTTETAVKSWLRAGQRNELQLRGVGARIAALAAASNLKPQQKQTLGAMKSFVDRLLTSAKQQSDDLTEERLKKLEDGNKQILDMLARVMPANR